MSPEKDKNMGFDKANVAEIIVRLNESWAVIINDPRRAQNYIFTHRNRSKYLQGICHPL